uniref:Ribosome biogenesis protein WDR12 homolog n=1 Tax=Lutzomyia longipalpis TaxID=7200 RepID=A0A7G3APY8_LUTLO
MEIETAEGQLQIQLKTKQKQYAVPDIPYSIAGSVSTVELNTLVNTLLQEADSCHKGVEFDFLVAGEFLRVNLGEHLKQLGISFEDIIDIEYVERFPSPEPQDCLIHDDWVSAVKCRNDWILTGCYDSTLNIWTTKGEHRLTIPGHTSPIKAVTWISLDADNGMFVSTSQDQTAMIWSWDIAKNKAECLYVCRGHERGIDCVDVSGNGQKMATGSWDTMLKIWSASPEESADEAAAAKKARMEQGKARTPLITLQGHKEAISAVQWIDNDTILTGSWDHTMKIWDLSLEGLKSEIVGNKSFFDVHFSKLNGMIITCSADKNLRLFDPRGGKGASHTVQSTYLGHTQWVQSVCWSSSEEHLFISGSYDNQVKLWDMRSPKAPLFDLSGHEEKVMDCDWSNPKFMISGGADNTVRIFKSKKVVRL